MERGVFFLTQLFTQRTDKTSVNVTTGQLLYSNLLSALGEIKDTACAPGFVRDHPSVQWTVQTRETGNDSTLSSITLQKKNDPSSITVYSDGSVRISQTHPAPPNTLEPPDTVSATDSNGDGTLDAVDSYASFTPESAALYTKLIWMANSFSFKPRDYVGTCVPAVHGG